MSELRHHSLDAETPQSEWVPEAALKRVARNPLEVSQLLAQHSTATTYRDSQRPPMSSGPFGSCSSMVVSRDLVQGFLDGGLELKDEPVHGSGMYNLYGSPNEFLRLHGLSYNKPIRGARLP